MYNLLCRNILCVSLAWHINIISRPDLLIQNKGKKTFTHNFINIPSYIPTCWRNTKKKNRKHFTFYFVFYSWARNQVPMFWPDFLPFYTISPIIQLMKFSILCSWPDLILVPQWNETIEHSITPLQQSTFKLCSLKHKGSLDKSTTWSVHIVFMTFSLGA